MGERSFVSSEKSQTPQLLIRFVSLLDKRQIDDIDVITQMLNNQGFVVDHFEYKVTKKMEVQRPINPKLKNSPKERFVVEEKLNVNANLKTVGQLEWRVLKDPENILLIQLHRSKGETLCLPLIYPNIFKQNHQILVTGLPNSVRLQLLSKPDLKFLQIPILIEENPDFKEQLIQRASRSKGMQATARELLDFPGLPEEISKKITLIATGKKENLSDSQAINLILLSDLHSRYSAMFQTFQNEIIERKSAVAKLARQFEMLTQKISTRILVSRLVDFLGENAEKCKTNHHVFVYLYQRLQQMEERQIYVNKKLLDRKDLFKLLRSIVCVARSQFDPEEWSKCLFYLKQEGVHSVEEFNDETISNLASQSRNRLAETNAAASKSLIEIYVINNIRDFIIEKRVFIIKNAISKQENEILKSTIAPQLHLNVTKDAKGKNVHRLFENSNANIQKLINPLHCVASAYGTLITELLTENLKKLMQHDVKSLAQRFGTHFFDIFYEQSVIEPGLQISRRCFALWFEQQIGLKPENLGFIPNEIEKELDPMLTPEIINGNGLSVFPATFSNEDFEKDYVKQRSRFFSFFIKLKQMRSAQKDELNPAGIFLDFIDQGKYNLRSPAFRQYVKNTYLYEELSRIVKEACNTIKTRLAEEAINKKVILKLPLKFSSLLYIGNTFEIPTGKFIVQIRLHTIPVKVIGEDLGISQGFFERFSKVLQEGDNPEKKALIQAARILDEYRKESLDYFRYLSMILIDQQIHQCLLRQKKTECDPRLIKFKLADKEKMIIGSIKDVNLTKLLQYDFGTTKSEKDVVNNQSFGEMIQSIMYYQSVIKGLAGRKEVISEIKDLLKKFSDTLKNGQEWKGYSTLANKISDLISLPIESFDEKIILTLSDLSTRMNRLVTKFEYKDSVIAILHAEWKRRNPDRAKNVYFYLAFLGDEITGSKTNLLLEMRKARDLIKLLKRKKALIFFPGATKEIQIKQMIEITEFIKLQSLDLELYAETRTLNDEKISELSRVFYPTSFFELNKLEPIKL